jgi:hypothetical protein
MTIRVLKHRKLGVISMVIQFPFCNVLGECSLWRTYRARMCQLAWFYSTLQPRLVVTDFI